MTRPELRLNRDLALAILTGTSAPEAQRAWRSTRDAARRVLRAARLPGYFDLPLAGCDYEFLKEALAELRKEQVEDEPADYDWNQADFVATNGRG